MYTETMYVHTCGTHTEIFKNEKLIEIFFSCENPVCRLGAHSLSHYTFFSDSNMVL